MNIEVYLREDSQQRLVSVTALKTIKKVSSGDVEEFSDFQNLYLLDDSSYIFIGRETLLVRGSDIVYVLFKES